MKNLDLIERYFENALGPKEHIQFNDLLQTDESFKNEFLFQKDLKIAIKNHQNQELKSSMEQIEKKLQRSVGFRIIPMKWVAAASLALLLTVGVWGLRNYVYPSHQAIYDNYYEPYPNTVLPIVRGSEVNSIEYIAFVAYESGEYHKAINLFNSVDNESDSYIQFYKAMCYLSVDKASEAIETLLPLVNASSKDLSEIEWSQKAQWYIGLAHLKQGNTQEAANYFNSLSDQKHEFHFRKNDAETIVKYLN